MKMFKRFMASIIVFALVFGTVACTQDEVPADSGGDSGTYETVVEGYNGDIKLEVELEDGKIADINILEDEETEEIGGFAFDELIPEIIETQSLKVDSISGATFTSEALKKGVEEIVADHANLDDFMKDVETSEEGETIEKTVDVVVIGAGAAGLSAAVEASKAGADTLVIEKMPKVGGNTAISSGNIYVTGSETQDELGLGDNGTPEELTQFLMDQAEGHANRDLISFVSERSGQTLDWLVKDIGVEVKHREPESSDRAVISETSGVGITDKLSERALEQETEIMVDTEATELIEEDGRVVGVKAKHKNDEVIIHAKSVVFASGGYDGTDEAKAKYAPGSVGHHTFASPGNVGDAIEMVKPLDGKILLKGGLSGIHLVDGQALNSPIASLRMIHHGVGVTDLGYRYANESMTSAFDYYNPMVKTGRDQFFNIVDSSIENEKLEQAVEEGAAYKAETIEEVAELAGIPEYTLKTTIEEYNKAVENGVDEEFGKDSEDMIPLTKAPFYAVKITPNTNGSFGGLVTDLETHVLNESNEPIPGLYAAGAVANSEYFYLKYPVSGSSIAMGLTLGRVAGTKAALDAQ